MTSKFVQQLHSQELWNRAFVLLQFNSQLLLFSVAIYHWLLDLWRDGLVTSAFINIPPFQIASLNLDPSLRPFVCLPRENKAFIFFGFKEMLFDLLLYLGNCSPNFLEICNNSRLAPFQLAPFNLDPKFQTCWWSLTLTLCCLPILALNTCFCQACWGVYLTKHSTRICSGRGIVGH